MFIMFIPMLTIIIFFPYTTLFRSEIYAIYLLEKYQGKGIGKQLTRRLVERLVAEGFQSMLVIVLAENEAKYFYEALGGELIEDRKSTRLNSSHVANSYAVFCSKQI